MAVEGPDMDMRLHCAEVGKEVLLIPDIETRYPVCTERCDKECSINSAYIFLNRDGQTGTNNQYACNL